MNSLIVMITDMIGNFTNDPFQSMLKPYIAALGDFFYGFLIMGMAMVIYVNTEGNTRLVTMSIWLLSSITASGLAINAFGENINIFHTGLLAILGVVASIVIGAIIYKGWIAKTEY